MTQTLLTTAKHFEGDLSANLEGNRTGFNETLRDSALLHVVWTANLTINGFNALGTFSGELFLWTRITCATCKILKLLCCCRDKITRYDEQ